MVPLSPKARLPATLSLASALSESARVGWLLASVAAEPSAMSRPLLKLLTLIVASRLLPNPLLPSNDSWSARSVRSVPLPRSMELPTLRPPLSATLIWLRPVEWT